ncbi:MAG TPA: hypothetical protein VNJ28_05095 [Candidatus Limnocylindrales bacterium]|nr:hypothetical protein [Candidatus Limnocylindrales bacterium]
MSEHHVHEHREVVVDRGSNVGALIAAILVVLLLIAVWWFTLGPGAGGQTQTQPQEPAAPSLAAPSLAAPSVEAPSP